MGKISSYTLTDPALSDFSLGDTSAPTTVRFQRDREQGLIATTPGGRLTLESGVPVSTSDQLAKTSIFYTPYIHNGIRIWDGTRIVALTFAETTFALGTLTAGKPYDLFGFISGGALALEALVWTNDTTRATALVQSAEGLTKSGDRTRLLLGTFYTVQATTTEDSLKKRYVGNLYNKVLRPMLISDGAVSWNYTTDTYRQANANTANQLDCVSPDPMTALVNLIPFAQNTLINTRVEVAIGLDSTTTQAAESTGGTINMTAASNICALSASWSGYLTAGRHILVWLEKSQAAGTTSWFGSSGTTKSTLMGTILL